VDPEAEQQAAAAERAAEASVDFEDLVADGNSDPVGALVASLRADPFIAKVERLDGGGSVIATTTAGVSFGVLVAEQNRSEWAPVSPSPMPAIFRGRLERSVSGPNPQNASGPITCGPANYPQSKKACVLQTPDFALLGGEEIEEPLQRTGFEVVPLSQLAFPSRAQDIVKLHQTMGSCGVLYISAHGGMNTNFESDQPSNHIVTEVEIGDEEKFFQELSVLGPAFPGKFKQYFGQASHDGKTFLTLSPEFFASVQYQNTLVFMNACSSAEPVPTPFLNAGSMPLKDAFRNNGAGAFIGWTKKIPTEIANPAANALFNAMAPKSSGIENVQLSAPGSVGAGQSYTPSATISPAQLGVQVRLTVRGTDGFRRDETVTTNIGGVATFASIPGGAAGVIDSLTAVAGGADASQTALNAALGDPALQIGWALPWLPGPVNVNALSLDVRNAEFNLVCNNQKLTETLAVVKFSGGPGGVVSRTR
jgi:hypothetical protein